MLRLVQSNNRALKGAGLRFACLGGDEELGSLLVNSEFTFSADGEFLDSIWAPNLFVRFAAHVPFEKLARRMHPADAGFALSNRCATPDDIDLYANLLDGCIHRIIGAPDPDITRLPRIVANPAEQAPAAFPSFAQQEEGRPVKSSDLTWGAQPPQEFDEQSLRDLFDTEKFAETQNRLSRERVQDIFTAWNTDAYNWFGRSFSRDALNLVCQRRPDLVTKWVTQFVAAGAAFGRIRGRLGSLMGQLCSVLLFQKPDLGQELWAMLKTENRGAVLFDSMLAAFLAADSDAASKARWEVLYDCWDDGALGRFAYLADACGKTSWLLAAVAELVSHPAVYSRAKGLTIASFSNMSIDEFDTYLAKASIEDTWVGPQTSSLRAHVLENEHAQHWYRVFLDADSEDRSWGAMKTFLMCGDIRFFTWRNKYELESNSNHIRRLKFLEANVDVKQGLDRENRRKETLFGIKIERGEIYPFTER